MTSTVYFEAEARKKQSEGMDIVGRAVGSTMGPRGTNASLDVGNDIEDTNDGLKLSESIDLKDRHMNMGVKRQQNVARKTNKMCGDGTSTTICLNTAAKNEGEKYIDKGVNMNKVAKGMIQAADMAVEYLKNMSKPVKTKLQLEQVANISVEDVEIGKTIAEALTAVGKHGFVTVESSRTFGVSKEITTGLEFDSGYVSNYVVTDTKRMEAVMKNPLILLTDKRITNPADLLPAMQAVMDNGVRELVVIAEDVDGDALQFMAMNTLQGKFHVLAIKAPGYGDRRTQLLNDMAVVLDATPILGETGKKLEEADLTVLGSAKRIEVGKNRTKIIGGRGKKKAITDLAVKLMAQEQLETSEYEKEFLKERIAKLVGGVGIIRVGGITPEEATYLKDKVDDALEATKGSREEGVVPGGGIALLKVASIMREEILEKQPELMQGDTGIGFRVVLKAMEAPFRQIVANVGNDNASVLIDQILKGKEAFGYDADKDELCPDIFKAGIIDPVKVTRHALVNAIHSSARFLTTGVAVVLDEVKKEPRE